MSKSQAYMPLFYKNMPYFWKNTAYLSNICSILNKFKVLLIKKQPATVVVF